MLIGIARIEIYIPMATSLKEKRRVIKGYGYKVNSGNVIV